MSKFSGFDFYYKILKQPKLICAPMVEGSELAFRMQMRYNNADLCYTPMFNAGLFVKSHQYREEMFTTCAEDRPLIVQFCANDKNILLEACKLVEEFCDGVDLNLGCPQQIAKRGHYGAFLQDEWDLLHSMVSLCHKELKVPITCKIRIFDDVEKTIKYAKMLENAGCQILTVHGRTREQKGLNTFLANWEQIRLVKQALNIPVFANGNIQYFDDIQRCFDFTNVDGVMSAEGCLYNPGLFTNRIYSSTFLAKQYLRFSEKYPCQISSSRGHIFKILHPSLKLEDSEMKRARDTIAEANTIDHLSSAVDIVQKRWSCFLKEKSLVNELAEFGTKFYSQPYYRPKLLTDMPDETSSRHEERLLDLKRKIEEKKMGNSNEMSMRKMKKLLKNPYKLTKSRELRNFISCRQKFCKNPCSSACTFQMCKACCKIEAKEKIEDCKQHRLNFRSFNEKIENSAT